MGEPIEWVALDSTRWFISHRTQREQSGARPPDVLHDGGCWWLVPYFVAVPTMEQRVGPFSTKELAQAAAEALYETGTNLFEEDV